jgi:divalent metal cation (Fe/Co/Zn/Cd) transporter
MSEKLSLGRTRLEPIAIIILSVIMCAASVLVIYESINTIVNDAQYFTEKNTTKTLSEIDMSAFPVSIMTITIVSKAILFTLCHRVNTPTMSALSEDHRNDVASNIVALICGLVGIKIKINYFYILNCFFKVHLHIRIK